MKRFIGLSVFLGFLSPTLSTGQNIEGGGEHLVPAPIVLSSYDFQFDFHSRYRTLVFPDGDDKPAARVFFFPSEVMLTLRRKDDRKWLVERTYPSPRIWGRQDLSETEIVRDTIEIDHNIAEKILKGWWSVLGTVAYPENQPHKVDSGKTILTAFKVGYGLRSGQLPKRFKEDGMIVALQRLLSKIDKYVINPDYRESVIIEVEEAADGLLLFFP